MVTSLDIDFYGKLHTERSQVSSMLGEIPRMLFESGFITELPCRRIYVGAMGEVDIREEKEDF